MYKVMLVDDEDMEREAMAEIIPWEALGMELVDTAWNGIEGLEKIRRHVPDIVITDIKMPVMDGLELIENAQKLFPQMMFVVLSGYGEYEYTSNAMKMGIRHYILKPCDEHKIMEVLSNVKSELQDMEAKEKEEREVRSDLQRMLPKLKEQILYELITKKELSLSNQFLLQKILDAPADDFILLSVRSHQEFGQLDGFVLSNILAELLDQDQIFMRTSFRKELLYLIRASAAEEIGEVMDKAHEEYYKYNQVRLRSAISRRGKITESAALYGQVQELFHFGELEEERGLLRYEMYSDESRTISMLVDYEGVRNAKSYEELLFEIYCASVKMRCRHLTLEKMRDIYGFALNILFGDEASELQPCGELWELIEQVVEQCACQMNLAMPETKDGKRLKDVLYAIYRNIGNPDVSLQYLAQNVLFMNVDYFGRFFARYMEEKYSSYLVRIRMQLVRRLLWYNPDMKIADLAEETGYPYDGQYLTKVFKKQTGMLLSDYRKTARQKR